MTNLQPLLSYLESHDVHAWAENGRLFAHGVYFQAGDDAATVKTEELVPTASAVRAWLGY